MPKECAQLRHAPYSKTQCNRCGAFFPGFMRGQVQSWWRKKFGLPYCAVICHACKEIIGWESPPKGSI